MWSKSTYLGTVLSGTGNSDAKVNEPGFVPLVRKERPTHTSKAGHYSQELELFYLAQRESTVSSSLVVAALYTTGSDYTVAQGNRICFNWCTV